jgi:replication initiation protein RepC
MSYHPRTPFRRAHSAARLTDFIPPAQSGADHPAHDLSNQPVDKWAVLRELGAARSGFGLSDRSLSVLQALLSFHSESELSLTETPPIVFPSNAAICARLNGMPCSTMRRHLAALIQAGVLIRRDSPNGKRFKQQFGAMTQAFGFDLSPLVLRFAEIKDCADALRAEQARNHQLRTTLSVMNRDLGALSELARIERPDLVIWDRFSDLAALSSRALRRKLGPGDLGTLTQSIEAALADLQAAIDKYIAPDLGSTHTQNEQHHQSSNIDLEVISVQKPSMHEDPLHQDPLQDDRPKKDSLEKSRLRKDERRKNEPGSRHSVSASPALSATSDRAEDQTISLQFVRSTCLEMSSYLDGPLRDWADLHRAAHALRPMMGISNAVWASALEVMGPDQASIVLAAMLERLTEIRNPNGYLRKLSMKSETGSFTPAPMLLALALARRPLAKSSQL